VKQEEETPEEAVRAAGCLMLKEIEAAHFSNTRGQKGGQKHWWLR
jgi:hypothetical protein